MLWHKRIDQWCFYSRNHGVSLLVWKLQWQLFRKCLVTDTENELLLERKIEDLQHAGDVKQKYDNLQQTFSTQTKAVSTLEGECAVRFDLCCLERVCVCFRYVIVWGGAWVSLTLIVTRPPRMWKYVYVSIIHPIYPCSWEPYSLLIHVFRTFK